MKNPLGIILPSQLKRQFRSPACKCSLPSDIDRGKLSQMCCFIGGTKPLLGDALSCVGNRFWIIQWHVHDFSSQFC
jgi:hypothetical protein